MSDSKDSQEPPAPLDTIKLPTGEELREFKIERFKEEQIANAMKLGHTREEAESLVNDMIETFSDPVKCEEFFAAYRAWKQLSPEQKEEVGEEIEGLIAEKTEAERRLEEKTHPKPELKVWTDAEDKRRSNPKSDEPDLP